MTPEQFVAKWKASKLRERQASQEQFIDLCRLLDEKTPAEADATGESYCFERGAAKMEGGEGWADVWKPGLTREALTADAAERFSELAARLHKRGHDPQAVAHFVNRLVFCMFAEDVDLLPNKMFARLIAHARDKPAEFEPMARDLFGAMQKGRRVGFEKVEWFNGGLFDDDAAFPLEKADVELLERTAKLDWAEIDPSIFGTLFERGLDPEKRGQLGAHYTDAGKIMKIVEPVIVRPLTAEWQAVKAEIADKMAKAAKASAAATKTARRNEARKLHQEFLERLRNFRVLDPACGSGNFLYLALLALKDIEHRANLDAEAMGLERPFPGVGPQAVKGIELNVYAAELARVTVWIGEIQWMRRNGFKVAGEPVLKPLDTIECRDAVLNVDGTEATWPAVDAIIGNPPFLGARLMKRSLGVEYVDSLRSAYKGRLQAFSDLVCYWFEKARAEVSAGRVRRVGLVATSSIRGGTNRPVMDRVARDLSIFEAWSEEPWIIEGANVEVSIVCFSRKNGDSPQRHFNGQPVSNINADLTTGLDLTRALRLRENNDVSFLGVQKSGPFDVPGERAREWMRSPINPNGRSNAEVLKPYWNGDDLTARPRDVWFVDLPLGLTESEAALFERPFGHLQHARDENGKKPS